MSGPVKRAEESENEEEYWYPELGLKVNPFKVRDASVELNMVVFNQSFQDPAAMLEAGESAVIVGPWGSGKTTIAAALASKYKNSILIPDYKDVAKIAVAVMRQRHPEINWRMEEPSRIFDVVGDAFYDSMTEGVYRRIQQGRAIKDSGKLIRSQIYLHDNVTGGFYLVRQPDLFCDYCRQRCLLPAFREVGEGGRFEWDSWKAAGKALLEKETSDEACPIIYESSKYEDYHGWKIFIDSPNEATPKFLRDLGTYCFNLEARGAQILLFGTEPQINAAMRYSDKFRKWRTVYLRKPEPGFWPKLVEARVRQVQDGEYRPVFTDEAVSVLAEQTRFNPREFLKLCSDALIKAREAGRKEPVDTAFLSPDRTDGVDIVKRALKAFKDGGRTAVKNRELMDELRKLGFHVEPRRLDRLMRMQGLKAR